MFKFKSPQTILLFAALSIFVLGASLPGSAQGYTGPWWWQIYNPPTSASWTFDGLGDIKGIASAALQVLRRNAGGTGVEWGSAVAPIATHADLLDLGYPAGHTGFASSSHTHLDKALLGGDNSVDFKTKDLNASGTVRSTSGYFLGTQDLDDRFWQKTELGGASSTYIDAFATQALVLTGADTVATYGSVITDTLSEFDGVATFTPKYAGDYAYCISPVSYDLDETWETRIRIMKNGVKYKDYFVNGGATTYNWPSITCVLRLNAGDQVSILKAQTVGTGGVWGGGTLKYLSNSLTIRRLPDPYVESSFLPEVYAYCATDVPLIDGVIRIASFGTEIYDTYNSFNGTTFVPPYNGVWEIEAQVSLSPDPGGQYADVAIYDGGTEKARGQQSAETGGSSLRVYFIGTLTTGSSITAKVYYDGSTYGVMYGYPSVIVTWFKAKCLKKN